MKRIAALTVWISLIHCWTRSTYGQLANTDYEVIWQFQRNGLNFWGETNKAQLPDIYLTTGNKVTFIWNFNEEYIFHSLYMTTDFSKYEACDTNGATAYALMTPNGNVDISLDAGTYYFFDRVDPSPSTGETYCEHGQMKQVVVFQAPDDFNPPETTPPTTVAEKENITSANATVIFWRYGDVQESINMTQDESIRFLWSTDEPLSVWQVTREAFEECSLLTGRLKQLSDGPSPQGDILVRDLTIGDNYFISGQPTHCDQGNMKIKVTVVPGLIRLWVNVWADTTTENPVNVTMTGFDQQGRVWSSPEKQVNQRALITDFSRFETLPVGGDSNFFEMFVLDVGSVVSVHVQRLPDDLWTANYIRIRKPDTSTESQTFRCGAVALHHETSNLNDQHCIMTTEEIVTNSSRIPEDSPAMNSCTCFREFQIVSDRVVTCTSDGCFSTSADGLNGWSDVIEISHILGIGSDGHYYGTDSKNRTLLSKNAGLTWIVPEIVAPIDVPPLLYTFDVEELPRIPLDIHTFGGSTLWGLTAQGIHVNSNGTWDLHAMWACNCAGACGLECNQPSPNLL